MSTESNEPKRRVITLTGRPPVRIIEDQWPVIARGSYDWHDGQVRCQANRTTEINLRVRRHADGRVLVYATYHYSSSWQNESNQSFKVGKLYSESDLDLALAIRDVGRQLIERLDQHGNGDIAHVRTMIDECIADLPVEDL